MSDYPTSIRIPSDLKRDLQKEAERQDRPVSWIIIQALRDSLPAWIKWKQAQK